MSSKKSTCGIEFFRQFFANNLVFFHIFSLFLQKKGPLASTNVWKVPDFTPRDTKPDSSCKRRYQLVPQLQIRLPIQRSYFISFDHDLLSSQRSTGNRSVCMQASDVRSARVASNQRVLWGPLRHQSNWFLHAAVLQQAGIHWSVQWWVEDDSGTALLARA